MDFFFYVPFTFLYIFFWCPISLLRYSLHRGLTYWDIFKEWNNFIFSCYFFIYYYNQNQTYSSFLNFYRLRSKNIQRKDSISIFKWSLDLFGLSTNDLSESTHNIILKYNNLIMPYVSAIKLSSEHALTLYFYNRCNKKKKNNWVRTLL